MKSLEKITRNKIIREHFNREESRKESMKYKKDTLVRILKDKQPFCACGLISDVEYIVWDTLTMWLPVGLGQSQSTHLPNRQTSKGTILAKFF